MHCLKRLILKLFLLPDLLKLLWPLLCIAHHPAHQHLRDPMLACDISVVAELLLALVHYIHELGVRQVLAAAPLVLEARALLGRRI